MPHHTTDTPNQAETPFCDGLPCLRDRPQWVCWGYIDRDGKATKCPVNPRAISPRSASSSPRRIRSRAWMDNCVACRERTPIRLRFQVRSATLT